MLIGWVSDEATIGTGLTLATVVLPSAGLAALLTLWLGRRMRPPLRRTVAVAALAALPWAAWITALVILPEASLSTGRQLSLSAAQVVAGLVGAVPAALLTRRAAVMPRGRRAGDR